MKHLLNSMSEQEKKAIREQHTGGMKLSNEKFRNLVEGKLGDVKTLVKESKTCCKQLLHFASRCNFFKCI